MIPSKLCFQPLFHSKGRDNSIPKIALRWLLPMQVGGGKMEEHLPYLLPQAFLTGSMTPILRRLSFTSHDNMENAELRQMNSSYNLFPVFFFLSTSPSFMVVYTYHGTTKLYKSKHTKSGTLTENVMQERSHP